MKNLLKLEELAQFLVIVFALNYQPIHLSWWLWTLVFFSPDLGMLGYLANPAFGALTYNVLHHKAVAIFILAVSYFTHQPLGILAGLILYGHSSFDRIMGYGLKYRDAFKHTHLGWL